MYKLAPVNFITNEHDTVIHLEKMMAIPFDPANTDYQEFLRWCNEGNEPLPADEGEA